MKFNNVFIISIILILIKIGRNKELKTSCGYNNKGKPSSKEEIQNDKRQLSDTEYKNLSIIYDINMIENYIDTYSLRKYYSIIKSSFDIVTQTLNSLLRVVEKYCYDFPANGLDKYGYYSWNKAKFGISQSNPYFKTCDYNIDLFIVSRFFNSDEIEDNENKDHIIISQILYINAKTGKPFIGSIAINQRIMQSNAKLKNFEDFFKSSLLHHFIHLLGFDNWVMDSYFSNYIIKEIDIYGIKRKYINSTNVIKTAKKYYNCSDIKGVELEDNSTSLHWESRILLGEIMTVIEYEPEQVISEFTLALLQDTGYYIPYFYTGGLMQYGRNKGCKFIKEKCVQNEIIYSKFENEFHSINTIKSSKGIDPSCSSGRQSRTYSVIYIYYVPIPSYYQYFTNSSYGGYEYADFCPVAEDYYEERKNAYNFGRCNKLGSSDYGTMINYSDNKYYKSSELKNITGEIYSDHSFCYQSSLYKNNITNKDYYSNVIRSICYESFCSSKSLTIKIFDNYIVCPRQGGKISAIGFVGYILCPDYYLICSSNIICNDMFDCVKKKSKIKEESYNYDYESKTSQNLIRAEKEEIDNENNYELSDDGICNKNCKQCLDNNKCIKCRKNYIFLGNKENDEILCINESEVEKGYYKDENNSIYYKCGKNCGKCLNDLICIKCEENYTKVNNSNICYLINELIPYYRQDPNDKYNYIKCNLIYDNCLTCNSTQCLSCKNNYIFTNDNFLHCKEINTNSIFTIFLLQVKIKSNELFLYTISEPKTENISFIKLLLNINFKRNLRNLEQEKKIVKAIKNNDNGINRIEEFIITPENININNIDSFQIEDIIIEANDNNNKYYINYPENLSDRGEIKIQDLKSKEEINFNEKSKDKSYKINIYKIKNIVNDCEFELITDIKINNNKNIILAFTEINKNSNIVNINCNLSSIYSDKIKCKTDHKLNNYYFLKDFIYYDNYELFLIISYNKTKDYYLLCENNPIPILTYIPDPTSTKTNFVSEDTTSSSQYLEENIQRKNKSSESLSTKGIIGIIMSIIVTALVVLIIVIIYKNRKTCCICYKHNPPPGQNPITSSTSENINNITEVKDIPPVKPMVVKENNEDIIRREIYFRTSIGRKEIISIAENRKFEELIKMFFEKVNHPELFGDKDIRFLCGGDEIKQDCKESVSKLFEKINEIFIIVTDLQNKINQ